MREETRQDVLFSVKEFIVTIIGYTAAFGLTLALVGAVEIVSNLF